jgi:hypothetical protein
MSGWMAGLLATWMAGWLDGWLAGWLACLAGLSGLPGWTVCFAWMARLAGYLAGCLDGRPAGLAWLDWTGTVMSQLTWREYSCETDIRLTCIITWR